MNTTETVIAFLGSAAVGALVSSVITVFAQWRERVGRQRELLFASAIDPSKVWVGRIAAASKSNAILSEVTALERTHEMLKEIFERGTMSEKNRKFLNGIIQRAEELSKPPNPAV
jgi:hypothetical protein